jgi:hypothetical protein
MTFFNLTKVITMAVLFTQTGCPAGKEPAPRLVQFIGVDISGSFKRSRKDALEFTAHYIYTHINGLGGAKKPKALFVGSIGGARKNEPKTFYPIENFLYKTLDGIRSELKRIFPKNRNNPFTDYNAFFKQVNSYVLNNKLLMKPISIILLTDGLPDTPKKSGRHNYRSFDLKPLERLSRNITVRVLYTSASTGLNWHNKVPRRRVRIWTQDANVMRNWKSRDLLQKNKAFKDQTRFFSWLKKNVDFTAPIRPVE